MPEAVKRECGKTFGVHLNQMRLVGFFDDGYANFIAVDWFVKKVYPSRLLPSKLTAGAG